LRLPGFGAREGEGAALPVDLLPAKAKLLSAPEAGDEGEADDEPVTRGEGLQESPLFAGAQKAHGGRRGLGKPNFRKRIDRQDVVAHGAIQEMAEKFEVVQDGLRGEALALQLAALVIQPGGGAVGEGELLAAIEPPRFVGGVLWRAGADGVDLPGLDERSEQRCGLVFVGFWEEAALPLFCFGLLVKLAGFLGAGEAAEVLHAPADGDPDIPDLLAGGVGPGAEAAIGFSAGHA